MNNKNMNNLLFSQKSNIKESRRKARQIRREYKAQEAKFKSMLWKSNNNNNNNNNYKTESTGIIIESSNIKYNNPLQQVLSNLTISIK